MPIYKSVILIEEIKCAHIDVVRVHEFYYVEMDIGQCMALVSFIKYVMEYKFKGSMGGYKFYINFDSIFREILENS